MENTMINENNDELIEEETDDELTNEIYLGDLTGDVECVVGFVHYMPFHAVYGLKKSREELGETGIFVEALPDPETPEGKQAVLYVNRETKAVWYEYEDRPLSADEKGKQLEQQLIAVTALVNMLLLPPEL